MSAEGPDIPRVGQASGERSRSPSARAPHPRGTPQDRDSGVLDPPANALVVGWLREHGESPHRFRPRAEVSYFIRLDAEGAATTIWSPGLKRALESSLTRPQIGDQIGIRRIEILPVVIPPEGKAPPGPPPAPSKPRDYWVVERREFFEERLAAASALRDPRVHPREAIRAHPELLGAYFALDSARKVADERIARPENRERFVALVRESLAHATERGEPLPSPRARAAPTSQTSRRARSARATPRDDRTR